MVNCPKMVSVLLFHQYVRKFILELDQSTIVNKSASKRPKIIIQFLVDSGAKLAVTKSQSNNMNTELTDVTCEVDLTWNDYIPSLLFPRIFYISIIKKYHKYVVFTSLHQYHDT